jgi:hypothetical protein
VHRDVKLENLLLADDGMVRVADCGNLAEEGDTTTAHDPTYFPPDWAALLPDGRHVFEDPASLAASNSVALDLRGLGMALIKGYAGKLPDAVSLEAAAAFSTSSSCLGSTSHAARCAGSSTGSIMGSAASSKSRTTASAAQFDEREKARLLRIAHHEWAASIDELVPASSTAALNQLAKLLMGPKEALPSLAQILQQPAIKAVHRQVLSTVRKARKPWAAHVAACRAAASHVLAPLMQLEAQLLQVYSDGCLSSMPPLSEQFELLAEQYAAQQERESTSGALKEQQASHMPSAAQQQEPSDAEPVLAEEAAPQHGQQQQCGEQQAAWINDAEAVTVLAYSSSTVDSGSLFDEGAQDSPVSLELPQPASAAHQAVLQPAGEAASNHSGTAAELTLADAAPAATSSVTDLVAEPNVAAVGAAPLPAAAGSFEVVVPDAADTKSASAGPPLLGFVTGTDTELSSDLSAQQETDFAVTAAVFPVSQTGSLELLGQQAASPLGTVKLEQLAEAPVQMTYHTNTQNSTSVSDVAQHRSALSTVLHAVTAQSGTAGAWSPAAAASSSRGLLPGNTVTSGVTAAAASSVADAGCAGTDAAATRLLGLGDSSNTQLPSVLCSQQDAAGPMHCVSETELRLQLDAVFVLSAEPVAMSAAARFGPGLGISLISSGATGSAYHEPVEDGVEATPAVVMQLQPLGEMPLHGGGGGGGGQQQVSSATITQEQLVAVAAAAAGSVPGNSNSRAGSEGGWSSHEVSPRSGSVQGFELQTTGSDDTSWEVDVEVVMPDGLEADQDKQASMAMGAVHAWRGVAAPWWRAPPLEMGASGQKAWVEMQGTLPAASATGNRVVQ